MLMKKQLLLLIVLLPMLLLAQQQVKFPDDFQSDALDGKVVTITNPLTLTNNYNVNLKNQSITLSNGLLWTPTERNLPDVEMFKEMNATNAANQLYLLPGDYSYIDSNGTCRIGQTVTNLTGTLSYDPSKKKYSLTPSSKPVFAGNERPTSVDLKADTYNAKLASFNILNYNDHGDMQRIKITAALKALDADIYALAEVKSNALEGLCNSLNEALATQRYAYIANTASTTGVVCAFIYNSEKVEPYKDLKLNTLALWNNRVYLKERKVAQAFNLKANKERFIVCLNHWKAKDSDGDTGDGQSGSLHKRKIEAEATLQFVEEIKEYYEDPDVLIVGDLNSYSKEDPIRILEDGGFINQLQRYSPQGYSYAYNSNGSNAVGYLDHSLANASMSQQVTDARPFHINADEPRNFIIGKANPQPDNMYGCSDHNPIVTALLLGTTGIHNTSSSASLPALRLTGDPRSGYLNLVARTDITLVRAEIVNSSGQIVAGYDVLPNSTYKEDFKLPVRGLASGFYIVRAYDAEGGCSTCKAVLP